MTPAQTTRRSDGITTYEGPKPHRFPRLRRVLRRWLGVEEDRRDAFDYTLRIEERVYKHAANASENHQNLVDAIGGAIWKTKTGHSRGIAFLSDTHLQALLDGNFGSFVVRRAALAEQDRREEDDTWAKKQGTASLRDRVTQLEDTTVKKFFERTASPTGRLVNSECNFQFYNDDELVDAPDDASTECNVGLGIDFASLERNALLRMLALLADDFRKGPGK